MPESSAVLTFGRGLNARARTSDVAGSECVQGQNYDLDLDFSGFSRRKPFDLSGTATNAERINGFAQLIKADDTVTTLVQAGAEVYSWDGASSFTSVGTVDSGSRLRGPREHNFTLDDTVIITDLAKATVVKTWDGTDFKDMAHDLGGNLFAKYCIVENERAFYGNVKTSTDTPHVVLGSTRGDFDALSESVRPIAENNPEDPFFIPMPDLRPMNGLKAGLGVVMMGTTQGQLYVLTGSNAQDFALEPLYLGSAVSGDEAMENIGNDMIFGPPGRIESLSGTLNFGDVETDDISRWIKPLVDEVKSWTIVYDRRNQKVLCIPGGGNVVYVMHKGVITAGDGLSPWSPWKTAHASSFQPTAIMAMRRPTDNLEVIYFGDNTGNIYQFDGDGGQDGGSADIKVFRESGLIMPEEGKVFDVTGYIHYRRIADATVTLTFQHQGVNVFDQPITINLEADTTGAFYGATDYYGEEKYYGSRFARRLTRREATIAGRSTALQVRVEIDGAVDFEIDELGVTVTSA